MSREVVAEIDSQAIIHNFNRIKTLAPNSAILPIIKSDAYGHGLIGVAKQLQNADALGVANCEEALRLREAGIKLPIVVMLGFSDHDELMLIQKNNLTAVVHQSYQVDLLEKTPLKTPIKIWLKIDTGMNRLGVDIDEVNTIYQRLQSRENIEKPIGLMTHLASADIDESYTHKQIALFDKTVEPFQGPKSIVNSAGLLAYQKAHVDWVRPGIMLYGVSPFSDRCGIDEGLKPVMTVKAKLIARKLVKKDQPIGYGCTWHCPENMLVGVVAIGYGDGYPRHAVSGTPTLVGNKICPLVGRISMNMITVDLRPNKNAAVGDDVTLWGEGLPVETIAKHADTIPYELLCGISSRVKCKIN